MDNLIMDKKTTTQFTFLIIHEPDIWSTSLKLLFMCKFSIYYCAKIHQFYLHSLHKCSNDKDFTMDGQADETNA